MLLWYFQRSDLILVFYNRLIQILLTSCLAAGTFCITTKYFIIMSSQNYKNHARYYAPHHFVFLPLTGFMLVWGLVNAYRHEEKRVEWLLFSLLSFCILYLAVMLRQHYALGNQNRIVRLEFRLRYFELYGSSSSTVESQLSFSQIAALRFAGDKEFKALLEQALQHNLSADEIKKRITNWQADYMRV